MPDRASNASRRALRGLQRDVRRTYDRIARAILAAITVHLAAIVLDDATATPTQRRRYAAQNGQEEIVALFVAYMITANSEAIERINAVMDEVASSNYQYVRDMVKRDVDIDIGGDAEFEPSRFTARAYNRERGERHLRRTVTGQIRRGILCGDNADQMAMRIRRAVFVSLAAANRIAETETTRISSYARLQAMREAARRGVEIQKVWRHNYRGDRPRDWHEDLNGITLPHDEDFDVGGTPMAGPGDIRGGPHNNCYCMCTLDIEIIRP